MSRGKKGSTGRSMQIISTTKRSKLPKWLAGTFEERARRRDISSKKRLQRLEAKGKIEHLGVTVALHSCGTPTELTQQYITIKGRLGHYASWCPNCKEFVQAG